MSTIALKPKFDEYILSETNHPKVYEEVKKAWDEAQGLDGIDGKINIVKVPGLDNYIIKYNSKYNERITSEDSHIYRIRKIEKIRRLIEYYQLGEYVATPKKYLYRVADPDGDVWVVVAEKLHLSKAIPTFHPDTPKEELEKYQKHVAVRPHLSWDEQRDITPEQARALAIFAFEAGLTDLTLDNLFFTEEGKLAIIDTEPLKRHLMKAKYSSWPSWLLLDKNIDRIRYAFLGLRKLKFFLGNREAIQQVEKIEQYYLTKYVVKQIAKIISVIGISYLASSYCHKILAVVIVTLSTKWIITRIQTIQNLFTFISQIKTDEGYNRVWQLETQGKL